MVKPPSRAHRRGSLPPGAVAYRPRPKPIRSAPAPAPDPSALDLAPEQLEALRAIANDRRPWHPLDDMPHSRARELRDAGLIELRPPPSIMRHETRAIRLLIPDKRPWEASITQLGRVLLERREGK